MFKQKVKAELRVVQKLRYNHAPLVGYVRHHQLSKAHPRILEMPINRKAANFTLTIKALSTASLLGLSGPSHRPPGWCTRVAATVS